MKALRGLRDRVSFSVAFVALYLALGMAFGFKGQEETCGPKTKHSS